MFELQYVPLALPFFLLTLGFSFFSLSWFNCKSCILPMRNSVLARVQRCLCCWLRWSAVIWTSVIGWNF